MKPRRTLFAKPLGPHLGRLLATMPVVLFAGVRPAGALPPPAFVPWPQEYATTQGTCILGNGKRIVYENQSLATLAAITAKDIRMATLAPR